MSLSGRGAVVTGGGRGIGADVARVLAGEGCAVVVAARTGAEIDGVASELRGAGARAWALPCDVTDADSVKRLAAEAEEALGTIDILVNNAGVVRASPVHKQTLEDWHLMMSVNATGTFLCTQAMLGGMVARGWGRVVNVVSVAGLRGAPYISAYAASKHAAIGFTRSVAAEVRGRGVTVNAVCPGYVDTPMTDGSVANIAERTGMSEEEARAAVLETSGQTRFITSGEVAEAVRWLCTEAAGISGQMLVINAGGYQT